VREFTKSSGDSISILNSFGVTGKKAVAIELTCKIAIKAGLVVCIQGIAARPAVECWVKTFNCSGVIIDSTVGLIDDTISRNVLAKRPEVLTILDANLSALDIYAKSLSDLAIERISKSVAGQFPAIFLVLSDSVGALPLPRTFERVSILLDFWTLITIFAKTIMSKMACLNFSKLMMALCINDYGGQLLDN